MTETTETINGTEEQKAPEIPRSGWETLIILHRHGRYDSSRPATPGQPTEEEQSRQGRLTPEGRVEAAQRADERIDAALTQDPEHTDFLLINSPTYWLDDERLGQRARETTEIIAKEVEQKLQAKGLDPKDHVLNLSQREDGTWVFKGGASRPVKEIQESQMFQFPEYANFMRGKYEGQGPKFWQARNADVDAQERERIGAPGAADDAKEISDGVALVARFARRYHNRAENKNRKLVVWMVTHGDGLDPYVQRVVGAPATDFSAGYNEGIGIAIDKNGKAQTAIKGKEYRLSLPESGREVHVRSNDELGTT